MPFLVQAALRALIFIYVLCLSSRYLHTFTMEPVIAHIATDPERVHTVMVTTATTDGWLSTTPFILVLDLLILCNNQPITLCLRQLELILC